MIIAHNISAINTYNKMGVSSKATDKSMEKLSSGYNINKAADDAAGLSISEKMRSQIRGLNQASENAQNGISMIQTAEGALNEAHSICQRMRELAVQAANDTNAASDREALQSEMDQLTSEINRIGNTTEFNGMKLLNGSKTTKTGKEQIEISNAISNQTLQVGTSGVTNRAKLELSTGTGITITAAQSDVDYSGLKAEAGANTITIGKENGKVTATVKLTYADGTTAVSSKQLIQNGDAWIYDEHGLSFSVTNDSVQNFITNGDDSDCASIDLYTACIAKGATVADGKFNVSGANSDDAKKTAAATKKDILQTQLGSDYTVTDNGNGSLTVSSKVAADATAAGTINAAMTALKTSGCLTNLSTGGTAEALTEATAGSAGSIVINYAAAGFSLENDYEADSSYRGTITYSLDAWDSGSRIDYDRVEIEYDNAATSTTGGKLIVNYYSGSDRVISENIACDSYGTLAANTTLYTYNANGLSFTVDGKAGFTAEEKIHAIIDLDKFGTSIVQNNGSATDNSVYFHVGANTNQVINTTFGDMRASALKLTGTGEAYTSEYTVNNGSESTATEKGLNISTRSGANTAIDIIDNAITAISAERSKYGAIQNRLEYTINNIDTTSENMTSAESTIRDTDMASEMMEMTKNQILQQASQAMLTQAMQRPQQVLQLLQG